MSLKPIETGALRKSNKEAKTEIKYPVKYEYSPMYKMCGHNKKNKVNRLVGRDL